MSIVFLIIALVTKSHDPPSNRSLFDASSHAATSCCRTNNDPFMTLHLLGRLPVCIEGSLNLSLVALETGPSPAADSKGRLLYSSRSELSDFLHLTEIGHPTACPVGASFKQGLGPGIGTWKIRRFQEAQGHIAWRRGQTLKIRKKGA